MSSFVDAMQLEAYREPYNGSAISPVIRLAFGITGLTKSGTGELATRVEDALILSL